MFKNKLKLNPDKTEFLVIGNTCHRSKFHGKFPISILNNSISPSKTAKNLGVTLDQDFNFTCHVNQTIRTCNYHIREIRRIRHLLDMDSAISIANALVSSRLDYCNSLLYGLPKKQIYKLQLVQNSLARVVTRSPKKYTSCTRLREQLHWLPINSRIHFKINVLVFKALIHNNPPSLAKHLSIRDVPIYLRSTEGIVLNHGRLCRSFGKRSFSAYAPQVWNSLPAQIRNCPTVSTFRKALKTYYFVHPP